MKFKGAIFDLDGTILDSMFVWRKIDVEFLGKRGLSVPEDYLAKIVSLNFNEAAEYTIEKFNLNETKEAIIEEWFEMAIYSYGNEVGFKPNAKQYLDYLRQLKIPIGVATSSDERLYKAAFANLHISGYFDSIVTSGEIGCGKTNPDIYIEAAKRLGVSSSECVVFEDILDGMNSAKSAGFFTVIMEDDTSKIHREELKANADMYITDFSQILKENILF